MFGRVVSVRCVGEGVIVRDVWESGECDRCLGEW